MKFVLIRHGETDWNEARRYQGWEDRPLTERGRRTARDVGSLLQDHGIVEFELWSSDLRRARDTAVLAFGVDPTVDTRLREYDFGDFAGHTYEENMARFGERFRGWVGDPERVTPPAGESLGAFHARLDEWWDERIQDGPRDRRVVVVAHGGVLRAFVRRFVDSEYLPGNGDACVVHLTPDRPTSVEHLSHDSKGAVS